MFTRIYLLFIFISIVFGGDDDEAKLRLYQTGLKDYSEVPLKNVTDLCSNPYFISNRTTKIVIHGFNGKPETGTAIKTMVETFMNHSNNVILVNWEKLAANKFPIVEISYTLAVNNAIQLASDLADALLVMSKDCLDLNTTHVLGHSLGAHVAGLAGTKMAQKGKKLPWITGLDPTGNYFNFKPERNRLNAESADFVDVIHTDPSNYGTRKSMGQVDFWANYKDGYVDQPGCNHDPSNKKFSDEDLCNHNRCWQLLFDALYKFPATIYGRYAENYDSWMESKAQKNTTEVLEIGKNDPNAKYGNYYFTTAAASPYGLGMDGT